MLLFFNLTVFFFIPQHYKMNWLLPFVKKTGYKFLTLTFCVVDAFLSPGPQESDPDTRGKPLTPSSFNLDNGYYGIYQVLLKFSYNAIHLFGIWIYGGYCLYSGLG